MKLAFEASIVSCADAIDGEIQQVKFDTTESNYDETDRRTPYVLIGRNFDFSDAATIEWHDGNDYDGGGEIKSVTLSKTHVSIKIDRRIDIEVTFRLDDKRFVELKAFLTRIYPRTRLAA